MAFYAARPRRIPEVARWRRDRAQAPLDLRVPWWPFIAVTGVASRLPVGARAFEFGGGGSTLWLQDQGVQVTTVEHDPEWHRALQRSLPKPEDMILSQPGEAGALLTSLHPGKFFDDYVATINGFQDGIFDLVILDGRVRVACGMAAMPKLRPGGMLLLDDSDRPKYAPLCKILDGWSRTDYRGLKPGGGLCQTSVWKRPPINAIS